MFNNKLAQIPALKMIIIMIMIVLIFVWAIIMLESTNSVSVDNTHINAQIAINKILNGNCFSKEYGVINANEYLASNLNLCLSGLKSVSIRVYLGSDGSTLIYYPSKSSFDLRSPGCVVSSNVKCYNYAFPVLYNSTKGVETLKILNINVLSYS